MLNRRHRELISKLKTFKDDPMTQLNINHTNHSPVNHDAGQDCLISRNSSESRCTPRRTASLEGMELKKTIKDNPEFNDLAKGKVSNGVNGIIRTYTKSPVPSKEFSSSSSERRQSDTSDNASSTVKSSQSKKVKSCDRPDSPRASNPRMRSPTSQRGSHSSCSEKQSKSLKSRLSSDRDFPIDDSNFFPISTVDQLKLKSLRSSTKLQSPDSVKQLKRRRSHGNNGQPLLANSPMFSTPKGTSNPPSNKTLNGISIVGSSDGEKDNDDFKTSDSDEYKPPSIFASPCSNCSKPYCNGVTCVLKRSPLKDSFPSESATASPKKTSKIDSTPRRSSTNSLHLSDLPCGNPSIIEKFRDFSTMCDSLKCSSVSTVPMKNTTTEDDMSTNCKTYVTKKEEVRIVPSKTTFVKVCMSLSISYITSWGFLLLSD